MSQWIKKGLKKRSKYQQREEKKDQVGHGFNLWSFFLLHLGCDH